MSACQVKHGKTRQNLFITIMLKENLRECCTALLATYSMSPQPSSTHSTTSRAQTCTGAQLILAGSPATRTSRTDLSSMPPLLCSLRELRFILLIRGNCRGSDRFLHITCFFLHFLTGPFFTLRDNF